MQAIEPSGPLIETTSDDVLALFEHSEVAMRAFAGWKQDSRRRGVHEVVLPHVVRHAYRITPEQLQDLNRRIANDSAARVRSGVKWTPYDCEALHPLAEIRSRDVSPRRNRAARRVADWTPPLAFNCAFHHLLEQKQELFTFPELLVSMEEDPILRELLYDDGEKLRAELLGERWREPGEKQERRWNPDMLQSAFRWRIGSAYYSFIRELHVFAILRQTLTQLRIHPLADTLFRTDFWGGGQSWELLVRNDTYKSGLEGRKPPMEDFTADVSTQRYRIELDPPGVFGQAYLPPVDVLRRCTGPLNG